MSRRRAFTFVEFLVLLGVIVILLSIFVPYFASIRESARRGGCQENLLRIRNALISYAEENGGAYPRVVYDKTEHPNSYTAFTGSDDPNPFSSGSAVKPNDVTASLWLLVRNGLVEPGVFICPSTQDTPDLLLDAGGRAVSPLRRGNFRKASNLSYSYAMPFSSLFGDHGMTRDSRLGSFVLMADKNPGTIGANDNVCGPAYDAAPLELSKANSNNHQKAGQNVLYADGSVKFQTTPYCGVGGDNIYTALAAEPLPTAPKPSSYTGKGYCGPNAGPAWSDDTYLVPTDDEGIK